LINSVYKAGKKAGAIGGKISGAGGGGFIVFVSDPDVRPRVMQKLFKSGAQVISFSFGEQGAECWRV
jgi:D-glycero-alpha-D-manno-heptose-7-phosphate kinase